MFETPKILLIGIGGGGCTIISGCKSWPIVGVDTIADKTAYSSIKNFILAGGHLATGCNGNPSLGKKRITDKLEELRDTIVEYDVIFLVAGLGGGTGSAGLPTLASLCLELGKKVFSIATFPFPSRNSLEICNSINTVVDLNELLVPSLFLFQARKDGLSLNDSVRFYDKACLRIVDLLIENNIFFVHKSHIDSALSKVIREAHYEEILCYDGKALKAILNDDYKHYDLDSYYNSPKQMPIVPISQCELCKHFHGLKHSEDKVFKQPTCSAFMNGIPEELMWSIVPHDTNYPGDNGILFERKQAR